ncbi:M2 family metallopeptidase [Sutcliffiella horikoshii]|uniref:M2 family metallopeptidase n=1 Tax=Sutcliffiella horikoshii TaxID=79883 RepID=UPI00203AB464|nr:M2 family metallopeptidase [Sutcliffiella horikoshii]MCM3616489.1 M2 family metallopeptidase [Sutcliffiella horikoshii]
MLIENFLKEQNEQFQMLLKKSTHAGWMAQTTGEKKWAEEAGRASSEFSLFYAHKERYEQVKEFLKEPGLTPVQRRQLEILEYGMKENQLDKEAIKELSTLSSELNYLFNTYIPEVDGKKLSANDIREILLNSSDTQMREKAWKASKEVGKAVSEKLLELIKKRNESARKLGYDNYYQMSFANQELDMEEIFSMFSKLVEQSDETFRHLKGELDQQLAKKFDVKVDDLKPWHYVDPFFQEAPANERANLDAFFKGQDLEKLTADTFDSMDMPIEGLYASSDLEPREGKNPTAFCMDMNREGDIRVLCNNVDNTYWMGTMLHEFGHAAYNKYVNRDLPYLLRSYAHILTTESIAMLFGKMTENREWLSKFLKLEDKQLDEMMPSLEKHEQLKMLISGRWIITFVFFERQLYENPDQDLNSLWWETVEKVQLLNPPEDRTNPDWAAKIHFTLAPVYYQNYLLGELTAAQLYQYINKNVADEFFTKKVGAFIRDEFLAPGATYHWNEKIEKVTGEPLNPTYFVKAYCDNEKVSN